MPGGTQELTSKLLNVAKQARQVRVEGDNFLQLAEFMDRIAPVARRLEVLQQEAKNEELIEALDKDVSSAAELVQQCASKSEMYLLTHCRSIVRELESVARDMGKNLESLELQDDSELKATVANLSKDMQQAEFRVQASEERICRALERETSTIRSDMAVQTGLLVDIARTVGVEDFTQNPLALKNHIDRLKNDIQGPEDLQRMHVLGNLYDNFMRSIRNPGVSRRRLEDPYDSFLCPLTGEVMADPVTLVETQKTYERKAIEKWFEQCKQNGITPTCPLTKKTLESLELKPSLALRNIIDEWKARNEAARLENAGSILSSTSSEDDILFALDELQLLCRLNKLYKSRIRNMRLIPMIVDRLKDGEDVRCKALETLRLLAEDDDDVKEAIGETTAIWSAVKCLSRELTRERSLALLLLLELSKSLSLCEKIGASSGAILILVGMTNSTSEDRLAEEQADQTLNNLERCDANVRQMAENGRLKAVVSRLREGSEGDGLQMATIIAEIPMNNEGKALLAQSVSDILIRMLDSDKPAVREAALKALRTLSTLESNGPVLVQAGALQPLTRDLFMAGIGKVPARLKEVAATVLANIVSSSNRWENVQVDAEGNTLTSEQYVHNLLLLISNTGPAIEAKLLKVLLGLASSPDSVRDIVAHIRSFGAVVSLIQFLEQPQMELRVTSVKLLCALSLHMGQELADGLRITTRQLGTLVRFLQQPGVNEEISAAAGLLANLPAEDFSLTHALLDEGIVPILITRISDMKRGVARIGAGRYMQPFQEGLIAILARFTYDLDDPDMLSIAMDNDLCSLFTYLLQTMNSPQAQRWSALALENMSAKTKLLSQAPEPPSPKGFICCFGRQEPVMVGVCSIHGGKCSARETFCLVDAKAVEPLVACLESKDVGVVEATLQALSTLVQEPCDVERALQMLFEAGAVAPVVNILREHRTEGLTERSVWMVERMLRNGEIAQSIYSDVYTALVDTFGRGSYRARQLAERCLKHLNQIPNFSATYPAAGGPGRK